MKKFFALVVGAISAVCLLAGCTTNKNPASPAVDDVKKTGERMINGTEKAVNDVMDMGTTNDMTRSNNARNQSLDRNSTK